eukprot:Nk52_evm1s1851 gene=Nk52_evmTU1s1851
MTSTREFDYCIFGATGFTGAYVVEEMARVIGTDPSKKWALAGRNMEKLTDVLNRAKKTCGADKVDNAELITADVNDFKSLRAMCKRSKVLLNCVGPYRFFGEPVAIACIEGGCHYVDLCGEPAFMEKLYLDYNDKAVQNGVLLVNSCGFDSIPADLGVLHNIEQFSGGAECVSGVEALMAYDAGGASGPFAHYATWEAAVNGFKAVEDLKKIRKKINRPQLPITGPKLKKRGNISLSKELNCYLLPFMGADNSVIKRSQDSNYHSLSVSPVQFAAYTTVQTNWGLFLFVLMGTLFQFLSQFEFGKNLLLKYPQVFSLGVFSHAGPGEEIMKRATFNTTFIGYGYVDKPKSQTEKPNQKVITRVDGPEPGYIATSVMLVQSAIMVREQYNNLPYKSGVLTPAAAFYKTNLITRLKENGVSFSVVKKESI